MKIAYHNKDILFKVLGHRNPNVMMHQVGGEEEIVGILSSEMPLVEAKQRRADTVYLTKKGNIILIEFESAFRRSTLKKYLDYISYLMDWYPKKDITMFVVHTGNKKRGKKINKIRNVILEFTEFYLSDIDATKAYEDAKKAIQSGVDLNEYEEFNLIVLPLVDYNNRVENLEKGLKLLEQMKNETQRNRIVAGMVTAADKFLNKKQMIEIRRILKMTKLEKIMYEDYWIDERARLEQKNQRAEQERQAAEQELKNSKIQNKKLLDFMRESGVSEDLIEEAKKKILN